MKILKALFSSDYGMLGALLFLCIFFSFITYEQQQPVGEEGANRLSEEIIEKFPVAGSVLIVGKKGVDGSAFVEGIRKRLTREGWEIKGALTGGPPEFGRALRNVFETNSSLDLVACEQFFAQLPVVENLRKLNLNSSNLEFLNFSYNKRPL